MSLILYIDDILSRFDPVSTVEQSLQPYRHVVHYL